jgi:hypothetical protein
MKTTIELPDALASEAKELARAQGVTLRELVVVGLRREIERRATRRSQVDFDFPVVEGRLQAGVDPHDLLSYAYDFPRL